MSPIRSFAITLMTVAFSTVSLSALLPAAVGVAEPSSAVPFQDTQAVGYLGLCNKAGQQITHGFISTTPLAWRAVSSVAAPSNYAIAGRTAALYAYQPQQELPPGDWSGEQMTSSSRYTNPAHPMAAATASDDSLAEFISDFPVKWDGLVQLRLFLGAPDEQPYNQLYPALDLRVSGDRWTAVDGGPVDCKSGTSESIETILLPHPTVSASISSPARVGPGSSSPAGAAAPTGSATASTPVSAVPSQSAAADQSTSTSHSHTGRLVIVGVVALALLAAGSLIISRRNAKKGS